MKRMLPIFLTLSLALTACSEDESGSGIGRRPASIDDVPRVDLITVAISRVYVAPSDRTLHEVELRNVGMEDATWSNASLCSADACFGIADATLVADERQSFGVYSVDAGLMLQAGVGEVALVDADGIVHAYAAWGADPSTFGSALAAAALVSGAVETSEFVPLPFPFPATIDASFVWEDGGIGCAAPAGGDPATIDAGLCPAAAGPVLEITELLPWTPAPTDDNPDAGDSWVELHNISAEPVNLHGVRVCHLPSCVTFAAGTVLGIDGYALAHFGAEPPAEPLPELEIFTPAALAIGMVGEVAILAPGSVDVTVASAFQSFVRYGPTGGQLSVAAVSAGLWPEMFATALEPRIVGESLSHDLTTDLTADAWYTTTPTPKAENEDIGPTSDLWTSCSWPRPWNVAAPSDLIIRQIATTTPATILLENRGSDPVALDDLWLELNGDLLALAGAPTTPLPAGENLQVELAAAAACADITGDLCFPDAVVGEDGEALLFVDDGMAETLLQYLRWGEGTPSRASDAEAANIWPLARCALPPSVPDTALTLNSGADGQSPADYL